MTRDKVFRIMGGILYSKIRSLSLRGEGMYAVIKAGGHQYRVSPGDLLSIDRLEGQEGDKVVFDQVLAVEAEGGLRLGKPCVEGAKVHGVIFAQKKAPKIIVFKYKRRKNSKKKRGHKQPLTMIKITGFGEE